MKQKFVIYSHSFNINSGGIIVLHQLCHLLNENGYEAYLWPHKKPIFDKKNPLKSAYKFIKYLSRKRFKTNSLFNTPIATSKDLEDSIIVYPEIIDGNPLKAKKVVRWLLHKPGFHFGKFDFGNNELIFGYGKECSGSGIVVNDENVLAIKYIMNDIYKQTNFEKRSGSCYMIRKGKNKTIVHDEKESILVDSFSHKQLSEIFNKSKIFISYDTYTYYSTYASLCGCISIIIPDEGVSKHDWHPKIEDTYGLSYGLDDIKYANDTKELLCEYINQQEGKNNKMVEDFVINCESYSF